MLVIFYNNIDLLIFTARMILRYNKLAVKVAGLRAIHVDGIENIDFSDKVKKHPDYCLNMREILESVNLLGSPDPKNLYVSQQK